MLQGLIVKFPWSKTDQPGKGDFKPIVATDVPHCPVLILKTYLAMLQYGEGVNGYITPHIHMVADGSHRGIPAQKLSYPAALEDLKNLVIFLGRDPDTFDEHSARQGGATAASKAGIQLTDLKRHGGWASDRAAQRYVEATEKKRNTVPKVLVQARDAHGSFQLLQPLSDDSSQGLDVFQIKLQHSPFRLDMRVYDLLSV